MKQAVKKGAGVKKAGLAAFKEKHGLNYDPNQTDVSKISNANKPQEWYIMGKAFNQATMLPGLPKGMTISVLGHSNVGKSTLINHAFVSAINQGSVVVYFDTENSFSFNYAKQMGLKAEPIYGDVEVEDVDPETGEIVTHTENRIIDWEGDFLYYDTRKLAEQYGDWDYQQGKKVTKKRTRAVIEDIAMCMNEIMDAQEDGEIEQDILFIWDSVGSLGCFKEYSAKGIGNPMWTAAAISAAFNQIVNDRIPSSKKVSSKYTNTFLYINKIWLDSMTVQTGPALLKPKGGAALGYSARLSLLLGKQLVAGVKRLTATAKGFTYNYGIETNIKVLKNHLDAPYNVTYEGTMVACDCGFISPEDVDDYKKTHISDILKQLNEMSKGDVVISEADIEFSEEEVEE